MSTHAFGSRIASARLNVPPDELVFENGRIFTADNPDNAVELYRVAGAAHWSATDLPSDIEPGIRETGTWSPPELQSPNDEGQINMQLTYAFLFDYCGIEIDRDAGAARIDKYVTIHDSGTMLNPLIVSGQVYGAYGWGVGVALFEEFVYAGDGSFLSGTFADYLCPTAPEVPRPQILHMESPTTFTPSMSGPSMTSRGRSTSSLASSVSSMMYSLMPATSA